MDVNKFPVLYCYRHHDDSIMLIKVQSVTQFQSNIDSFHSALAHNFISELFVNVHSRRFALINTGRLYKYL